MEIRDDAPYVHNCAFGFNQQRRECLNRTQHAPEIDVEHLLAMVNVQV